MRERLTYACADVTAVTFGTEYDLVLSAYLHFPPPQRRALIDNAIAALKPDGILIFLGHDSTNPTEGVGGPRDPEILYTPTDLAEEMHDRLDIRTAERRMRETDAGMAIDALVVARKPTLGS